MLPVISARARTEQTLAITHDEKGQAHIMDEA